MFIVLDLFCADRKLPAEDVYNIARGILVSVAHEDLILLYVLTLLHPKLPHHIRERCQVGRRQNILDLKAEIFKEADGFVSSLEVKPELEAPDIDGSQVSLC